MEGGRTILDKILRSYWREIIFASVIRERCMRA